MSVEDLDFDFWFWFLVVISSKVIRKYSGFLLMRFIKIDLLEILETSQEESINETWVNQNYKVD